jgi:hypothetical protein
MIPMMEVKRVCLLHVKVSFRNGHDGLLGEAYKLGLEPYRGDMIVFIGPKKDRLKILFSDGTGLLVLYKRFNIGTLARKFKFFEDPLTTVITPAQVLNLIEGESHDNEF